MRPVWLLYSILVTVLVYLAANLILGPYNASELSRLRDHYERLSANLDDLKDRQNQLSARVDLLRRSSEEIEVRARALQYYAEGDEVIRIAGTGAGQSLLSPGRVVRGRPVTPDRLPTERALAGLAGLVTLVLLVVTGRTRKDRRAGHREMRRASR